MKNTRKLSLFVCALVALSVILGSCGAASGTAYDSSLKSEDFYNSSMEGDYGLNMSPSDTAPPKENNALANRKIVKTVSISAETKSFDAATELIRAKVGELGGYIEASNIRGTSMTSSSGIVRRTATFTLRIPADKLDEYIALVGSEVNVVSTRENIDDITDQYFDVDARLNSLKVEEERLLAMLAESKDLEYLIRLNDRLSEVRYEIENYTSTIRRYDNMVSYSTVNITLEEVIDYTVISDTPQSFGERFIIACRESWTNFVAGLGDFTIGLVYAAPALIIFAALITAAIIILIKVRKKAKAKNNKE